MRDYIGFLTLLALIATGLVLVGYLATGDADGGAARQAMLAGCALSLLASIVGSLAIVTARSRGVGPANVLGSLALRLLTVLPVAAVAAILGWVEPRSFLIWVGISYLAYLFADVRYALKAQTG